MIRAFVWPVTIALALAFGVLAERWLDPPYSWGATFVFGVTLGALAASLRSLTEPE